eukprot:CAMPEP_0203644398 /NCGR_PEP_ID=MMETSP0088-20131115/9819_1 /ASSEMBLY_ACC=CAM_ASM_001087 /TAXON_ID=426623 /ORGANISM="Chaetoceros affinis, Strain CCMP159" /LENGTH=102 /DNA_ID=CAMNT_0050500885 /DNA_START=45 /DNA_END=350 /DNA_ORIENTATION=+
MSVNFSFNSSSVSSELIFSFAGVAGGLLGAGGGGVFFSSAFFSISKNLFSISDNLLFMTLSCDPTASESSFTGAAGLGAGAGADAALLGLGCSGFFSSAFFC